MGHDPAAFWHVCGTRASAALSTAVTQWPSSQARPGVERELGGQGSNLQQPAPKAGVLPVELPPKDGPHGTRGVAPTRTGPGWRPRRVTTRVAPLMGSLIKKRRKRMRKKKHKKMLKRTRWQRRAAGK